MSVSSPDHSSESPWFIPYENNIENYGFTGLLIAAILHGIVIAFFCQCMGALLSPTHRKHKAGGIRWGLVAFTTAMFFFSTTALALNLDVLSYNYIGHRDYLILDLPGSLGYLGDNQGAVNIIVLSVTPLNQWLADGLLLYRCHVIYAMNYWVTAFPCLMYLASVSLGIVYIYTSSQAVFFGGLELDQWITLYFTITFSLNVLLTLMIVARLALCNHEIRAAMGISSRDDMGTSSRAGELYKAFATIFVESCAPYAISLLLYLVEQGIDSPRMDIFYPIFIETQVIAPFLIILRLANRTAVTSDSTIGSRTVDPARFRSHEETMGSYGVFPDEGPASVGLTDVPGEALNELSVGDGMAIEEVPLGGRTRSSFDK